MKKKTSMATVNVEHHAWSKPEQSMSLNSIELACLATLHVPVH